MMFCSRIPARTAIDGSSPRLGALDKRLVIAGPQLPQYSTLKAAPYSASMQYIASYLYVPATYRARATRSHTRYGPAVAALGS